MQLFLGHIQRKNVMKILPNRWDVLAFLLVVGIIVLLAIAAHQASTPYSLGEPLHISLDPSALPDYAIRSVFRMIIAMICSLLFTFTFATLAAKNRHAERIIIPIIDILQSVPVLAFLSISIVGFIRLFPKTLWGPECAAIFAIFTAQVWNMALSFYQSLKTIPNDLKEAADMFQLAPWQRFWRIEVPFAMPGLLWNAMMSMSGSWFFVVASEAISVSNQNITLPGIGSYIALAIEKADTHAVVYAIITMLFVILVYDQIIFRPLVKWSEKFKAEQTAAEKTSRSWVISLLQRTRLMRYWGNFFSLVSELFINYPWRKPLSHHHETNLKQRTILAINIIWYALLAGTVFFIAWISYTFIRSNFTGSEIGHVFFLGLITALRIIALILIISAIWVPLGVWIGLKPRIAEIVQPLTQFLAAFPAYLLFPLFVIVILKYQLNVEVWTTPLMILGTQWYVLFNVVAGAAAIPKDLHEVADNFGLSGWLWWRKVILPGIFPYYVTGAITAVGGAWNASIVAEVVSWGNITLKATGLGAYIKEYTTLGSFPQIALGIGVMCIFVLVINRIVWHPLYVMSQSRFKLE